MAGQKVLEHTFRRKDQLTNLDSVNAVKIKGEVVHIDPQLLFQRLITAGTRNEELDEVLTHELCSYPAALFDERNVMRAANKVGLADAMWLLMPKDASTCPPEEVQVVLDGGALLHRIPWEKGLTYGAICQMYVKYVASRYGTDVTIVFDGYAPSTKDATHQRRAKQTKIASSVHFDSNMVMNNKKDEFLDNSANKQRFLVILGEKLAESGCHISHAESDADNLIVLTTIEHARTVATVLVGDDTDLLILLCHHMPDQGTYNIYMKPESRTTTKKAPRCWDIKLLRRTLGLNICANILFARAILGCDTTSRLFGIGKGSY